MTSNCTASIIKLQQEEEEVRKNTDKTKYKPIGNGSPIPNVDPKNTQPGESKKNTKNIRRLDTPLCIVCCILLHMLFSFKVFTSNINASKNTLAHRPRPFEFAANCH